MDSTYLIYYTRQDGTQSQRTVQAQDAREARELFEQLYPAYTVTQVLDYQSLQADRLLPW